MISDTRPLTFWRTVRLLLRAARRRSVGRQERQQQLLRARGKGASTFRGFSFFLAVLMMIALNVLAGFVVIRAVKSGECVDVERRGKVVVSTGFFLRAVSAETEIQPSSDNTDHRFDSLPYSREAANLSEEYGGSRAEIEQNLRNAVHQHGSRSLITFDEASPGLVGVRNLQSVAAMLGSLVLLWWAAMLVCQGEGLELDTQRRRNPVWEFLFSHPVPPGAIFLAEMLSPIAANPIYWGGPLFVAVLYGAVYGVGSGFLAALVIGVPVTVAVACLGKSIEIAIILRVSPRSRGAMIGLMSWFGYASMMLFFIGLAGLPAAIAAVAPILARFTVLPWPCLALFLGGHPDGSFSFLFGMATCWLVAGLTIAAAVWFTVWGTGQGLSGAFASDSRPNSVKTAAIRFGKDPLYRKEYLWFIRDRSAIVQTILIPLTVAGLQVFNLRGVVSRAQGAWNYLCGAAILFGTYLLWVLGPKSLSSEGTALWISLTWPRGLESLLKAKAWLWSLISSAMVVLILLYAAYLYPSNIWQICLVGIGWFLFSRSMAEKTVTLVTVASSSGEHEQIPWGRRWAAQLGMLTFSIGVLTQHWNLAVVGIVYSYMTAAAMWQNFRARLPFLYDPWSETVPPAPTLMHAMIAISLLVEGGAVFTGILVAVAGPDNIAAAQAIGYIICALAVSIGVAMFLSNRDVQLRDVWRWEPDPSQISNSSSRLRSLVPSLSLAVAGGLSLALVASAYVAALRFFPTAAELLRKSHDQMAQVPNLKFWYAVMAICVAPFAEEYLFRGLLYRALDREWGGWRAVFGSAAFFAIYHPPLSWFPVLLVGAANAVLFKKTGRLTPAILLHMIYNAVVSLR